MKIVIVASDKSAAGALNTLLGRADPACRIAVVGYDSLHQSSQEEDLSEPPGLVLLDVDGALSDAEALAGICSKRYPRASLVAIGSGQNDTQVEAILNAGALGYLPKSVSETVAVGMLRVVLNGARHQSCSVPGKNMNAVSAAQPGQGVATKHPGTTDGFRLTGRQVEVLSLVAQGKSNQTIAKHLGIAEGTTKLHMTAIFKALNVQNRGEAMLLASRMQSVHFFQIKDIESGALDLDWLLPHMSHRRVPRDTTLFMKGDPGTELWYLQRGTIRLEEIGVELNSGAIFGEICLFSPLHERTATAVCTTDVDLFTLTSDQVKSISLQNPAFALLLAYLLVKHLMADRERAGQAPVAEV